MYKLETDSSGSGIMDIYNFSSYDFSEGVATQTV